MTIRVNLNKKQNLKQAGQTLLEFVFILLIVSGLSYLILTSVNERVADLWQVIVKLIVSDPSEQIVLR